MRFDRSERPMFRPLGHGTPTPGIISQPLCTRPLNDPAAKPSDGDSADVRTIISLDACCRVAQLVLATSLSQMSQHLHRDAALTKASEPAVLVALAAVACANIAALADAPAHLAQHTHDHYRPSHQGQDTEETSTSAASPMLVSVIVFSGIRIVSGGDSGDAHDASEDEAPPKQNCVLVARSSQRLHLCLIELRCYRRPAE